MAYSVPATYQLDQPLLLGLQQSTATIPGGMRLGQKVKSDDGREFQFVIMLSSAVRCYSGRPAVWFNSSDDYVTTPDLSDGGATSAGGADSHAGVYTANQVDVNSCYLWIQTKGKVNTALVSAAVAANDELLITAADIYDEAADHFDSTEDTPFTIVGKALTAAADGVASLHSTANIILF